MITDGFAKIDCGILDSSLWRMNPDRVLFITALLMAKPYELLDPTPQIKIRSLEPTGWEVPADWYGFIRASASSIIERAKLPVDEESLQALERLGSPDIESRSQDFDGRRLIRVDGGFIVLNLMKVRDDHREANRERQRRYRERKKKLVTKSDVMVTSVTRNGNALSRNAEAEAEAEADKNTTELPHQGVKGEHLGEFVPTETPLNGFNHSKDPNQFHPPRRSNVIDIANLPFTRAGLLQNKNVQGAVRDFVKHRYEKFGLQYTGREFHSLLNVLEHLPDAQTICKVIDRTISNGWKNLVIPDEAEYKR